MCYIESLWKLKPCDEEKLDKKWLEELLMLYNCNQSPVKSCSTSLT